MRMAAVIAVSVLRGWALRSRVPISRPRLLSAAIVAVALLVSAAVAASIGALRPYLPDGPYFTALLLASVYLLAALVTITTTAAAAQSSSTVVWWRTTPISDRGLAVGFSAPVWLIVVMQAVVITPGLTLLWIDSLGAPAAAALSLSAVIIGAAHGRGLFAVARVALSRAAPGWQVHTQPLSFILWAAHTAGAVAFMRQVPTSGSAEVFSQFLFPAGYPALAASVLYPGALSALALTGAWATAVALEVLCLRWTTAARQDAGPVLKVGPSYSGQGMLYVWRLEATRLIRRRRVQSAILSALVIQMVLCILVTRLDETLRESVIENALLLNALMLAYAPLLARGMSDRSRPYALWMGMNPAVWAVTVTASAVAIAVVAALPVLGVLAAVLGTADVFLSGLGLVLFMATLAAAVGFVLVPSDDTGAAETLGAGIVIGITFGAGKMLASAGIDGLGMVAMLLVAISPAVAVMPAIVETVRWNNLGENKGDPANNSMSSTQANDPEGVLS